MAIVDKKWSLDADGIGVDVVETALIDTPPSGGMAVYMQQCDNTRAGEIINGWETIRDFIMDNGLMDDDSAATGYVYLPLGQGRGNVVIEPVLANVPDDSLIVGMAGNYRTGFYGSVRISSLVGYCADYANDNYLKTV